MLSTPRNEFGRPLLVFGMPPAEVLTALPQRARRSRAQVAELDRELKSEAGPPRLYLIETGYLRTIAKAELDRVKGVVDDLRSGRLTWSRESIEEDVRRFPPSE